jgi:hypothetical protein
MSVRDNLLPQFFPRSWEDEYNAFGIAFTEDVTLGFVNRGDGGYSYLLKADAQALACSHAHLLSESLSNLAQLSDAAEVKIARPPGSTVAWVKAEDNFIAVRMLLPSVRSKVAKELGERYLFTVPSRDLCLCWAISSPTDLSEKHAREAEEDFASEEYNLSPHVYIYTDRWPCPRWK